MSEIIACWTNLNPFLPGTTVPIRSQMLFPLQIVAQLKKGKSTYYYFLGKIHLEPIDTNYKYGGLLGLAHAVGCPDF